MPLSRLGKEEKDAQMCFKREKGGWLRHREACPRERRVVTSQLLA